MKPERFARWPRAKGGALAPLRDVLPNPRMQPTSWAGARLRSGGTLRDRAKERGLRGRELDRPRLMRTSLGGPDDSPVT